MKSFDELRAQIDADPARRARVDALQGRWRDFPVYAGAQPLCDSCPLQGSTHRDSEPFLMCLSVNGCIYRSDDGQAPTR